MLGLTFSLLWDTVGLVIKEFVMSQNVALSRDEAELITDLLFMSNHHCARELSANIRGVFGMCSENVEIEAMRKLADDRKNKSSA